MSLYGDKLFLEEQILQKRGEIYATINVTLDSFSRTYEVLEKQ